MSSQLDKHNPLAYTNGADADLIHADPATVAEYADLVYVQDDSPGYGRRRQGKGFSYLDPAGKVVRDPALRQRFDALAIPPAWTGVWICPDPNGHLQATGRDDQGRKQYIYHPRWAEVRTRAKFDRMIHFAEALPKIRRQVDQDLRRRTLTFEKVVALVIRLLDDTKIRVGNVVSIPWVSMPLRCSRTNTKGRPFTPSGKDRPLLGSTLFTSRGLGRNPSTVLMYALGAWP